MSRCVGPLPRADSGPTGGHDPPGRRGGVPPQTGPDADTDVVASACSPTKIDRWGCLVGERGRPVKPTALKILHGDRSDRINDAEPVPLGLPVAPGTMSVAGRAVWDRLAPDRVAQGVLTVWDVDAFAAFCEVTAVLATAHRGMSGKPVPGAAPPIAKFRDLVQLAVTLGAKFGWTPSDRAKLAVGGRKESANSAERLLS